LISTRLSNAKARVLSSLGAVSLSDDGPLAHCSPLQRP